MAGPDVRLGKSAVGTPSITFEEYESSISVMFTDPVGINDDEVRLLRSYCFMAVPDEGYTLTTDEDGQTHTLTLTYSAYRYIEDATSTNDESFARLQYAAARLAEHLGR